MGTKTSSVISGIGSIYSGIQAKKEADKQARELQVEANFLADKKREQAENILQKQKLAYIKSGIQLDSESSQFMFKDTRQKGNSDASRILERGRKQSKNLKKQGRQALISGIFNAGKSGMTGFNEKK